MRSCNRKCAGCGIVLTSDASRIGYTPVIEKASLCQRCFKLTHYGQDPQPDAEAIQTHVSGVLDGFDYANAAAFYVCAPAQLLFETERIARIKSRAKAFCLVVSKIDCLADAKTLPKAERTIRGWLETAIPGGAPGFVLCSVFANMNYPALRDALEAAFAARLKAVFCGPTNAGKSSLINWLLRRQKIESAAPLTVSHHKNTTQNVKQIKLPKSGRLIDLPGFADADSFQSVMDPDQLKRFYGKNSEWKTTVYQLRAARRLAIDGLAEIFLFPDQRRGGAKAVAVAHMSNRARLRIANIGAEAPQTRPGWVAVERDLSKPANLLSLNNLGFVALKNIGRVVVSAPKTVSEPIVIPGGRL